MKLLVLVQIQIKESASEIQEINLNSNNITEKISLG